jgi:hypothetical protein
LELSNTPGGRVASPRLMKKSDRFSCRERTPCRSANDERRPPAVRNGVGWPSATTKGVIHRTARGSRAPRSRVDVGFLVQRTRAACGTVPGNLRESARQTHKSNVSSTARPWAATKERNRRQLRKRRNSGDTGRRGAWSLVLGSVCPHFSFGGWAAAIPEFAVARQK